MRFMTKTLELDQILKTIANHAKADTIVRDIMAMEPSTDKTMIERQLEETEDMVQLISRAGVLPLIENYDIHQLLSYASMERVFSIPELLNIRLFMIMERDLIRYTREALKQKIAFNSLTSYISDIHDHGSLLDYIHSKMDEDGQILDDATPELSKIRRELLKLEKRLQDKLHGLLNDLSSYLNESVVVMRNNRFCIPVKEAFKNKIKGVVHDMSASKQTVYIEPEQTRQITAEIESLHVSEEKEIQKIIALLSEEVHASHDSLKTNLDLFLTLDFIQSKAIYGKQTHAFKPRVNTEGVIRLIQARHPLLDPKTAVPIDVELNQDIKTLLITGPNTGGKTVALKTVGLLTLMMQSGLLIPAQEGSDLAIFDQVFADIGDEQSIQQSLSTFSSHLTKITEMANHLTDNALILLDELGSGTDPNEGVSLAIAIINFFKAYDIRMMVTTHYSQLKSYAYEQSNMATASVAFDKKTLKPLYFLQMGTTGSSHAFLIARRLGLPEPIIKDAQTVYKGRQTDLAKVMERLNDEMLYLEKQKSKLKEEIEANRLSKEAFNTKKEQLIKEQDQLLQNIRFKEEAKWRALRDEAQQVIQELKAKQTISNPELAELKGKLNQGVDPTIIDSFEESLEIGDEVFILPYQQYGIIKAIKDDQYRVIFGHFDLTFPSHDLRKHTTKKVEKPVVKRQKVDTGETPERKATFELDLRGFRFEEVGPAMDQAIDRALLSGLSTMRIIHGFGSGAVRKAVHDYIKRSPYIKGHRFGGEGEGLNGVTIITLK